MMESVAVGFLHMLNANLSGSFSIEISRKLILLSILLL